MIAWKTAERLALAGAGPQEAAEKANLAHLGEAGAMAGGGGLGVELPFGDLTDL